MPSPTTPAGGFSPDVASRNGPSVVGGGALQRQASSLRTPGDLKRANSGLDMQEMWNLSLCGTQYVRTRCVREWSHPRRTHSRSPSLTVGLPSACLAVITTSMISHRVPGPARGEGEVAEAVGDPALLRTFSTSERFDMVERRIAGVDR